MALNKNGTFTTSHFCVLPSVAAHPYFLITSKALRKDNKTLRRKQNRVYQRSWFLLEFMYQFHFLFVCKHHRRLYAHYETVDYIEFPVPSSVHSVDYSRGFNAQTETLNSAKQLTSIDTLSSQRISLIFALCQREDHFFCIRQLLLPPRSSIL